MPASPLPAVAAPARVWYPPFVGTDREGNGQFVKGHRLGGRKPGVPSLATALKTMLEDGVAVEELQAIVLGKLLAGDGRFWELILQRLWPAVQKVEEVLPDVHSDTFLPDADEDTAAELRESGVLH